MTMHKKMAETMDNSVIEEIKAIQKEMHVRNNDPERPVWPMIVLRTPRDGLDQRL